MVCGGGLAGGGYGCLVGEAVEDAQGKGGVAEDLGLEGLGLDILEAGG